MKQLASILLLLFTTLSFGQESGDKSSFLTRNQSFNLFPKYDSLEKGKTFRFVLPAEIDITSKPYWSVARNFTVNDSRRFNYPSRDLSESNDIVFGNFMNTAIDLGNTRLNTMYIFDQSGRLVNSNTSFTFGKKKRK